MAGAGLDADPFRSVAADLARVEAALNAAIGGDPREVAQPMAALFAAGGKRLRPALVLLAGSVGAYDFERLAQAAVAVELTHAATLVHDDVIDRSPTRRGAPTVAASKGNEAAIVIGDFYFAQAYREAARTGESRVVDVLARAVMEICAGEVRQQAIRYQYSTGVNEYMKRIEAKTAALIGASCEIGAMLADLDERSIAALRSFGRQLGSAFQIVDDVLDYIGTEEEIGKPTGHDIEEGFATLPVMFALDDAATGDELRRLLVNGAALNEASARTAADIVRRSSAPARCLAKAADLARQARETLADLAATSAIAELDSLTDYVVTRKL